MFFSCSSAVFSGFSRLEALWNQYDVDCFDEEQLRSVAMRWAEIYRSLETPSELKLSALEPVLERPAACGQKGCSAVRSVRLSSPSELRLMAVTGPEKVKAVDCRRMGQFAQERA